MIQRGPKGRLRLVSAGERRWSKAVEERFLAMLAVSGNIAGSARSVGFSESCIWQRRRKWPEFAQRMEEVLQDAEVRLEFRMATMGNDTDQRALGEGHAPPPEGTEDARSEAEAGLRFDPDLALRFLKWREAKRQGHDRWRGARPRKTWTFDESMELLEKKLKALGGRMEKQKLAEGWSKDETGYLIPPGWVRAEGGGGRAEENGDSYE